MYLLQKCYQNWQLQHIKCIIQLYYSAEFLYFNLKRNNYFGQMRSCLISQPCSCLQSAPRSLKFSHSLPADRNNWTIDNHSCGMPPNCNAFNYMCVYESLSLCFNRKNKRRRSDRESKKTEATDVDMPRHPTFHPDHEEFVLVRFLSALFYSKKL